MDADTQLAYVIRRAMIALHGQLFRMNSLSTDTYSTMRSLWKKLRASKELRHVFCSPCNSHGIQLFLKDILQLPWFKTVLSRVQQVVRAFRAAHKEYNLLREFQMDAYGKKIALILHCITRWGTQVGILESVLKNQQALQCYAQQATPQIDKNKKNKDTHILPILRDLPFWQDVATVSRILTPIHQIQYVSEADNYPLYRVLDNWMEIKAELLAIGQ